MNDLPGQDPKIASLEILRSASDILETLRPLVEQQLGEQTATTELPTDNWAEQVTEAAHRIQAASGAIFEQASDVQMVPVVADSAEPREAGGPHVDAVEPSSDDTPTETNTTETADLPSNEALSERELTQLTRGLVYMARRDGLTYKGKIIKRAFGTHNISDQQYESFIQRLDLLVEKEHLAKHGARYGMADDANLSTIPLLDIFGGEQGDNSAPDERGPTNQESDDTEPITLSSLEVDILGVVSGGDTFRVEEVKKQVPEIAGMGTARYDQFKKEFLGLRERLAAFLVQRSIPAEWKEGGKARGKHYALHIADRPTE